MDWGEWQAEPQSDRLRDPANSTAGLCEERSWSRDRTGRPSLNSLAVPCRSNVSLTEWLKVSSRKIVRAASDLGDCDEVVSGNAAHKEVVQVLPLLCYMPPLWMVVSSQPKQMAGGVISGIRYEIAGDVVQWIAEHLRRGIHTLIGTATSPNHFVRGSMHFRCEESILASASSLLLPPRELVFRLLTIVNASGGLRRFNQVDLAAFLCASWNADMIVGSDIQEFRFTIITRKVTVSQNHGFVWVLLKAWVIVCDCRSVIYHRPHQTNYNSLLRREL
nr:hypothetical protein CFP56_30835 [Quercus suber]